MLCERTLEVFDLGHIPRENRARCDSENIDIYFPTIILRLVFLSEVQASNNVYIFFSILTFWPDLIKGTTVNTFITPCRLL